MEVAIQFAAYCFVGTSLAFGYYGSNCTGQCSFHSNGLANGSPVLTGSSSQLDPTSWLPGDYSGFQYPHRKNNPERFTVIHANF